MKTKILMILLILVIGLSNLTYAHDFKDCDFKKYVVVESKADSNFKTYVILENKVNSKEKPSYKTFNIYEKHLQKTKLIANHKDIKSKSKYKTFNMYEKPSEREKLMMVYKRTKGIKELRYNHQKLMEDKERHLKSISKNWFSEIDGKEYHGYDEDIYGSKKLFLHWKKS